MRRLSSTCGSKRSRSSSRSTTASTSASRRSPSSASSSPAPSPSSPTDCTTSTTSSRSTTARTGTSAPRSASATRSSPSRSSPSRCSSSAGRATAPTRTGSARRSALRSTSPASSGASTLVDFDSWRAPRASTVLTLFSNHSAFQCILMYLQISYPSTAASVLAGNDLIRSCMAAGFPCVHFSLSLVAACCSSMLVKPRGLLTLARSPQALRRAVLPQPRRRTRLFPPRRAEHRLLHPARRVFPFPPLALGPC